MTLSSEFVVPGVTARCACPFFWHTFLKEPAARTCSDKTGVFTGDVPDCLDCLDCKVLNCEMCAGAQGKCRTCDHGHDLSLNKDSCDERKDKIIVLEGLKPHGHAGWPWPCYSASVLEPTLPCMTMWLCVGAWTKRGQVGESCFHTQGNLTLALGARVHSSRAPSTARTPAPTLAIL